MSITEDTNIDVSVEDVSLDDFADELFGQSKSQSEPASSEKSEDEPTVEDDAQEEKEDTQSGEQVDAPADREDEEPEVEAEAEAEAKPKKNRFQERIDELTSKAREAERKAQELEQRLAKFEKTNEPEPTPQVAAVTVDGPNPDDKNEDGTDKYPLGEFDPKFAADVVRHTLKQEREAMLEQEKADKARLEKEQEEAVLTASWNEKLEPAKERYPDFIEKGQNLGATFDSIDGTYADYLTTTIMSMEFGPDVLYYLANNLDEATKIVQSGATKATIALGRLESKFAEAEEQKQKARPKVSNAPTPPAHQNKGSAAAKAAIDPNTDDLDEFARALFSKK